MVSYDAFATTFSNSRKNMKWAELDAIIEDIRECSYTSVLDIGCGNGRFIESAEGRENTIKKYLGIDSSSGMIEEAKRLHPERNFRVCDMLSFSSISDEGLFDAIIFLASFHHLEAETDRLQVLMDAKKLLSLRGAIYMTNWNLHEQEKYKKNHRGNGDFDIKIGEFSRYYHGFTLSELEGLFRKTGYEVRENRVFEGGRNIWSKLSPI